MTGRTMRIDQLSRVMIWNGENRDSPMLPNHCGKLAPYSLVAMTANS